LPFPSSIEVGGGAMFNLTRQERQVVLFLAAMALAGIGISFAAKINSRIGKVITAGADNHLSKIDINQVAFEDLLHMRGISPSLAKKIIEYRNNNGPFKSCAELKKVKGIGNYRYDKLEGLFFVDE